MMLRKQIQQIEFKDLNFKNSRGEFVFRDLNMTLPAQGLIWVKGEGGAGKSVFIKMICGLIAPTSGQVLINNEVINQMTFEEFLPYRCNMGYSFDFGGLINNRDIVGNLLLGCQYHQFQLNGVTDLQKRAEEYLDIFGLKEVAHDRPSAIVGRLRKAVSVARAFIHDPQILLLDDPSTGLRSETKKQLIQHIKNKLNEGIVKQVFVATDDEDFMSQLPAQIIDIKNQKLTLRNERHAA